MIKSAVSTLGVAAALGLGGLLATAPAQAGSNMTDFMNPGKWFGGDRDRDRDYYYDRGWGRYGYPGYGYGYPGYGYGYPGYGYGYGYPGYGYGPGAGANTGSSTPPPPPTPQ